jgi:hypothetical protein
MWDACWRAAAYCLHPRVVLVCLLPLALAAAAVGSLGWAYWEAAVDGVRSLIDRWALSALLLGWLEQMGLRQLRSLLAPLLVVAAAVPLVVLVSLLLVALLATPVVVRLVAARRFAGLQARRGAGWWQSLGWTLACTAAALLALLASLPLWLVPPLVLVLPPLIWGWLTSRVLGFDVLALHATAAERRLLLRRHRWTLLAMGVLCGGLGALPSGLWVLSAATLMLAPVLLALTVWLYTGIFAFATAWFAHYLLAALQAHREAEAAAIAAALGAATPASLHDEDPPPALPPPPTPTALPGALP